ncbi:DNA polymerase/3'-5' exonuclease PolX [Flavihumibacter profundi]|uniref:DNA polymerase/3'-5' exonuclease PolX n=1 Tax=Flavihumibacter profundi TaxID=2716883 RepID=UPI001CC8174E|nr:DNA polymerase/3'-5' exonuclease PolX [Flavihumibacter profundi]MBZ5856320.1 DNA polymerase/3'-5' exonuclease PolX [Flavihumibacter profundi]
MSVKNSTAIARSHNTELAEIFHRMAACYRYLGPEHRFRAMAYEGAVKTISNLREDISVYATDVSSLDNLKGIGESIAEKILEYLDTGKIKTYEKLKKEVPQDLLELMDINGFGPATIKILHESLQVNNREDLIASIELGRIFKLKGFGEKRVENMKRGLKLFKEFHTRMLLSDALELGNEILLEVQGLTGVQKAMLAGSLRRMKETIGDIDIIAIAERKNWKKIITRLLQSEKVGRILASGDTKASFLVKNSTVQVDIRLVQEFEFGAALLYFTGSKEHNIHLRLMAKEKGWKLNEYGVFDVKTDKWIAGHKEEDIYKLLDLEFIEPELREDRGEIELALKNKLPKLIESRAICGDMQMHSMWSDGAESIETIARFIEKEFPQYEYIVITDHSPSERLARGLNPQDFIKQFDEIDEVNKKLKKDFIKKGVEVDILANGDLDLPDELLSQFDWVTASIHSLFNKDNTGRLIKACEHPFVHCIGHPSGRLIGKREAYTVDWVKLLQKAADTNTAIEINAQPNRLDLKDDLVKKAIELKVTITISTDAHDLNQFKFMQLGVAVARRGGCTRKNILNTNPWKSIEAFKENKHRLMSK